jgi:hypothetical protein
MINWEEYKFNEEHNVQIVDGENTFTLKVKMIEYEWSLHREPYIADLKVIETNDETMYPLDSIMRLPIKTQDNVNFLLFAPIDMAPAREFKRKGNITLLN